MRGVEEVAVDLATAATTATTIGIAVLALLADRTRARWRAQLGSYAYSLFGLMLLALYTAASDGLAWWAWTRAADSNPELLFGWPTCYWLVILFLPPLAVSAIVFGGSAFLLVRQVWRRAMRTWSA